MRIHRIPGLKRVIITTSLDDYSGEHASSPLTMDEQPTDLRFCRDNTPLLYYQNPLCPRCFSKHVSMNGTYTRDLQGHQVRMQKYICNDCSYSFEARPPGYSYGKHIPDDLKEKTTKSRVLSSLRKAAKMCGIFLGFAVSHETVRISVPDIPDRRGMESSGYFSYDEQYVSIDGERRYRFLLKDTITGSFHEDILPELGEDSTTAFILSSLSRFDIGSAVTITTDGYHYQNAFSRISAKLHIHVRRQRCLFHLMKDLTKKAYDAGKLNELRGAIDLINYMFFQTAENLEKLGKNAEPVMRMVTGKSGKDATFALLDLVRDLYSDDPIIRRFLKDLRKNRREIFRYLDDPKVEKTNNVAEHHFSMRSELLKKRFKTDQGLLKTSYWYHRLSTEN